MSELETQTEEKDGRLERLTLLVLGLLGLLTVVFLVWRESRANAPFTRHQQRYAELVGQALPRQGGVRRIANRDGTDRCPTCHLGIPGGTVAAAAARWPNPYRSHPAALLRQHPPGRFLCSACHGAGGAYVDRCLPALGDPDARALGRGLAQASCLGCHPGAQGRRLPGGETLEAGIAAYRRLGCGGCHRGGPLLADPPRVGPPLTRVWSKLAPGFIRRFIADPQRLRPGTAMPSFFSDRMLQGAPTFSQRRARARAAKHVDALVAFLRQGSRAWSAPTAAGDAARGARLFVERGCVACHRDGRGKLPDSTVGPDLSAAGARLSPAWVAAWLRRPSRYNPETRMPELRLGEDEVRDLTRYLASLGAPPAAPPGAPEPALVRRGRALAQELGCPGCHRVAGLEEAPPVGPDLGGFGDKREELLDWGTRRPEGTGRTWRRWTRLKLERPLAFDRPPGVLLMPWQKLEAGELDGLVVLMRALVERLPAGPRPAARATPLPELRVRSGEVLVQELGCRRCHELSGSGGALRKIWPQPADRAPALDGEGAKVQPGWLYRFLRGPRPLRPWLTLRMPTFTRLGGVGARSLAASFAARDKASYPFVMQEPRPLEGQRLSEALALFRKLQCVRCHLLSNAPRLKPGELAPDLALSGERLRRAWIARFILEPQKVMPGTRMPTLFPLEDEDDPGSRTTPAPALFGGDARRQIEALTELNLSWGVLDRDVRRAGESQ